MGRRSELNVSSLKNPVIDSLEAVDKLGDYATLSHGMAGDIFLTNKLFPWHHVPDIAIGRAITDNWIIWFARAIGAKVIDVTGTVLALHQSSSSVKKKTNWYQCNIDVLSEIKLLPHIPIWRGSIDCASYVTSFKANGEVRVVMKNQLAPACYSG